MCKQRKTLRKTKVQSTWRFSMFECFTMRPKGASAINFFSILAPLGDLGCQSGARWILKGSPNRPILNKMNIDYQKKEARSNARKNMKL